MTNEKYHYTFVFSEHAGAAHEADLPEALEWLTLPSEYDLGHKCLAAPCLEFGRAWVVFAVWERSSDCSDSTTEPVRAYDLSLPIDYRVFRRVITEERLNVGDIIGQTQPEQSEKQENHDQQ